MRICSKSGEPQIVDSGPLGSNTNGGGSRRVLHGFRKSLGPTGGVPLHWLT